MGLDAKFGLQGGLHPLLVALDPVVVPVDRFMILFEPEPFESQAAFCPPRHICAIDGCFVCGMLGESHRKGHAESTERVRPPKTSLSD